VVCSGYPYESHLSNSNFSFVAVGDYVFNLYGLANDGITFKGIQKVFIKKGAVAPEPKEKKKKSFKEKLAALKAMKESSGFGPEHKALQKQNLNEMITNYLVVMKAKQDARTPAQLKSQENIKKAKAQQVAAKDNEWAEAKRYNDSIKATPEWQELERRKRQNEANYQASKTKNTVTFYNISGSTIYVGTSGSRNPGTKISAGGSASWSCSQDGYIQSITKSGGSTAYKSTSRKVYSANTSCGGTVNIN